MNRVAKIARMEEVQPALARYAAELPAIIQQTIAIQQLPAPTFSEAGRAAYIQQRFEELGLERVQQDELHNVYGYYPGRNGGRPVILTAHSDTVFPAGTDLSVRHEGDRIYGPGIADNSLGVAGLLETIATLQRFDLRPPRPIWFVSNVGEEGLGDLRGMRAVVERFGRARAYIVLEGGLFGRVCHQAIGVRRFRIEVTAPGGHSWGAFGTPSAIHILGNLIAAIDRIKVPQSPKTTYNVGHISGGTTINTIAGAAHMLLDLRSEDPAALDRLVQQVEEIVQRAGRQADVEVKMTAIGSRPAGQIPRDTPLVHWAVEALRQVGAARMLEFTTGSTDANIPLSQGFPAVCVGLTSSGNAHRPDEYMEAGHLPAGLGQVLLLLLAAADYAF